MRKMKTCQACSGSGNCQICLGDGKKEFGAFKRNVKSAMVLEGVYVARVKV